MKEHKYLLTTFKLESVSPDIGIGNSRNLNMDIKLSLQNGVETKLFPYFSFIPLACADCNDSLVLSGASSISLCYITFPCTLFYQLVFHPPSLHLAIFFLVYISAFLFPNLYVIHFGNSIFFHSLYMSKPM